MLATILLHTGSTGSAVTTFSKLRMVELRIAVGIQVTRSLIVSNFTFDTIHYHDSLFRMPKDLEQKVILHYLRLPTSPFDSTAIPM